MLSIVSKVTGSLSRAEALKRTPAGRQTLHQREFCSSVLRKTHQALDRAVDRLYRPSGFASERERVEHLFGLYEKMMAPLEAGMRGEPRRKQRTTSRKNADPSITRR